jgi:hypothetical protein
MTLFVWKILLRLFGIMYCARLEHSTVVVCNMPLFSTIGLQSNFLAFLTRRKSLAMPSTSFGHVAVNISVCLQTYSSRRVT